MLIRENSVSITFGVYYMDITCIVLLPGGGVGLAGEGWPVAGLMSVGAMS